MNLKESILFTLNETFPNKTFEINVSSCKLFVSFNNKTFSFWLDDWFNKKEIVLSIINSKTGENKRVFARNCEVKKVNKLQAEAFINQNHLLGYKTAYFKYALFYQHEVIAIATFSKGRKMNRLDANKRSFELISFCCKKNVSVTGGLSKLLKAFVTDLQPGDIMTYIDKEWSDGNSYLKLGFKLHSETEPQTFVFDKINFEKYFSEKLPENILIELQSNNSNLEKVKNSGNLKLVYTL
ncbi:MAG: hypothetical protein ACOYMA_03195 [Bacteroidia bacterium]